MRNFQDILKKRKRPFISAFSICMTAPLMVLLFKLVGEFLLIRELLNRLYSSTLVGFLRYKNYSILVFEIFKYSIFNAN